MANSYVFKTTRFSPEKNDGTDKMYESGASEPDTDECGNELTETNAVGRLEDVEILQHVGYRHQAQSSRKPQTCSRSHARDTRNTITAS